jgi:hypothetical protein
MPRFVLSSACIVFLCSHLGAQRAFTLFVDCNNCDFNYLVQQIPYVGLVRVPTGADVRLLVTRGGTGGGGQQYELFFTGLTGDFEGQAEKVTYQIEANSSDDDIRNALLRGVKQGLLPYLVKTDRVQDIDYRVIAEEGAAEDDPTVDNRWDNWVFEVFGGGRYESEAVSTEATGEFNVEADRVTEAKRIRLDAFLEYTQISIDRDTATFIRVRRDYYAAGSMVWSLSDHWSAGGFGGYLYETFENLDNSYFGNAAIEYNIYPYSEVLRREISVAYRLGYRYNNYLETTIFEKNEEGLAYTSMYAQARFRQPWGTINTSLDASAFLRDLSQNEIQLRSNVDLNLYRGLALSFRIRASLISNQINLAAGNTSLEDLILQQRQVATNFRVDARIGVSYTFGYLTNNIINYRL